MPLTVRKFNAQVRDQTTGNMIPAGLLSSDALGAINTAKTDAIAAVQSQQTTSVNAVTAAGTAASANFPQTAAACDTLAGDFAATYVPNQAYSAGDYCTYQYQLYRCKADIPENTDATFVTSHWQVVKLANTLNDEVGDLKTQLDNSLTGSALNWAIGALTTATGKVTDSTTRIRSGFVPVGKNAKITYPSSNMAVFKYSSDKSFLGYDDWSTSFTADGTVKFVRIQLRNSSNTDIDAEDIPALVSDVDISLAIPQEIYFSEPFIKSVNMALSESGLFIKPTMTDGKRVGETGNLVDSTDSSASDYIEVEEGSVIYLKNLFISSNRYVILYDSDKNKLLAVANSSSDTTLTYTVPLGGAYIRATARLDEQIEYTLLVKDTFGNYVPKILRDTLTPDFDNTGYVQYSDGNINDSSAYKYSKPFYCYKGTLTIRGAGTSEVAILSSTNADGDSHTPLVQGLNANTNVYTYTVNSDGYYCISYRVANGTPEVFLDRDCKTVVLDNFDDIQSLKRYTEDPTALEIFDPSYTDGKYIAWATEKKTNSANYRLSAPIFLPKGALSVTAVAGTDVSVISKTNAEATYFTKVVQGRGTSSAQEYTCTISEPGYYCVSDRKSSGVKIAFRYSVNDRFDANMELEQNRVHNAELIDIYRKSDTGGNYTIKAFKTLSFSDGTLPKYSQVLWNDPSDDAYYISADVHSARTKVFVWNRELTRTDSEDPSTEAPSTMYQAVILKNGDVLFVYQTQFDHPSDNTGDGGQYRRNPIIYIADRDFAPQVIDFGESLKPTGWLQNCGVLYSYYHNRLYIAEYTRINEAEAHAWAVDMPVTDVSNWHAVLTKQITRTSDSDYQNGFKHFHTCQEDPFTNIIYFSSGDNILNSHLWYSTDGGNTLTDVYGSPNDGKFRMLNMAFTEDYVYWATDDWSPTHLLWKCSRITADGATKGVLDTENGLTEILAFEDEAGSGGAYGIATYSNIYLPMYNAVLFLDRDDRGDSTRIPVRVYDITDDALYTAGYVYPRTHTGTLHFGFRNVSVLLCPRDNEVAVSFDVNLQNTIKMLGNGSAANTKINNLLLYVYKDGTSYRITYDTVY